MLNINHWPLTAMQAPTLPAVHAQIACKLLNRKTFTFKVQWNLRREKETKTEKEKEKNGYSKHDLLSHSK